MAGDTALPQCSNLFIFPVRMESKSHGELSLASSMEFPLFPPTALVLCCCYFEPVSCYWASRQLSSFWMLFWNFLPKQALLEGAGWKYCERACAREWDVTDIGINIFWLPIKCRLWTENKAYIYKSIDKYLLYLQWVRFSLLSVQMGCPMLQGK